MSHNHRVWMPCTNPYYCQHRGVEGNAPDSLISFGPLTGCSELAAELMRHYEVDPSQHPEVLWEIEQAIGEEMLDIGRNILREHGIAYPGFDPTKETAQS